MTPDELARAKALDAAATKGPWTYRKSGLSENLHVNVPAHVVAIDTDEQHRRRISFVAECLGATFPNDANAAFIAAARTGWPQAIAEVERLRQRVAELERERDEAYREARRTALEEAIDVVRGYAGSGLVSIDPLHNKSEIGDSADSDPPLRIALCSIEPGSRRRA